MPGTMRLCYLQRPETGLHRKLESVGRPRGPRRSRRWTVQLLIGCHNLPSDARRLCIEMTCAILKACYVGFETDI